MLDLKTNMYNYDPIKFGRAMKSASGRRKNIVNVIAILPRSQFQGKENNNYPSDIGSGIDELVLDDSLNELRIDLEMKYLKNEKSLSLNEKITLNRLRDAFDKMIDVSHIAMEVSSAYKELKKTLKTLNYGNS